MRGQTDKPDIRPLLVAIETGRRGGQPHVFRMSSNPGVASAAAPSSAGLPAGLSKALLDNSLSD